MKKKKKLLQGRRRKSRRRGNVRGAQHNGMVNDKKRKGSQTEHINTNAGIRSDIKIKQQQKKTPP